MPSPRPTVPVHEHRTRASQLAGLLKREDNLISISMSSSESGPDNGPPLPQIDLSKPRYDQNTYLGRARHFYETANPVNLFVSNRRLAEAAQLVKDYKRGQAPPGTTEEHLWEAKRLYDSAYHPDTGEKMLLIGRMSFQVPGQMTVTGFMLTFYRHPAAVLLWQATNQAYMATINFTNRSGDNFIPTEILIRNGVAATTAATTTALILNKIVQKRLPPPIGRFVPFVAVIAANMVNIPLVRQEELKNGIQITDKDGNKLGDACSKKASKLALIKILLTRILIASPVMVVPPIIINSLEKRFPVTRGPAMSTLLSTGLAGLCLWFTVPLSLALWPQQSSLPISKLEPEVRDSVLRVAPNTDIVYYNKGL